MVARRELDAVGTTGPGRARRCAARLGHRDLLARAHQQQPDHVLAERVGDLELPRRPRGAAAADDLTPLLEGPARAEPDLGALRRREQLVGGVAAPVDDLLELGPQPQQPPVRGRADPERPGDVRGTLSRRAPGRGPGRSRWRSASGSSSAAAIALELRLVQPTSPQRGEHAVVAEGSALVASISVSRSGSSIRADQRRARDWPRSAPRSASITVWVASVARERRPARGRATNWEATWPRNSAADAGVVGRPVRTGVVVAGDQAPQLAVDDQRDRHRGGDAHVGEVLDVDRRDAAQRRVREVEGRIGARVEDRVQRHRARSRCRRSAGSS